MAAGAAAAAAIEQAVKARVFLVRLELEQFLNILARVDKPLIVTAQGGLSMPAGSEIVVTRSIWIPPQSLEYGPPAPVSWMEAQREARTAKVSLRLPDVWPRRGNAERAR